MDAELVVDIYHAVPWRIDLGPHPLRYRSTHGPTYLEADQHTDDNDQPQHHGQPHSPITDAIIDAISID